MSESTGPFSALIEAARAIVGPYHGSPIRMHGWILSYLASHPEGQ